MENIEAKKGETEHFPLPFLICLIENAIFNGKLLL